MNQQLQQLILERLAADEHIAAGVADLVLHACDGRDALAAALEDGGDGAVSRSVHRPRQDAEPAGAYLARVSATGFRGIGETAVLELPIGPGLSLVVGRNGSGKSSFAEALEVLMTNENRRWTGRTKIWAEGWRNVHHPTGTTVAAELQVDAKRGLLRMRRCWDDGAALADGRLEAVDGGGEPIALEALGWDVALTRFRPFLSYNELGSMFDEPKTMYDALSAILGLDDVEQLAKDLREERLACDRAIKDVRGELAAHLARLAPLHDERAISAAAALRRRPPDLDAVELALAGATERGDPEGDMASLRALATLTTPGAADVDRVLDRVDAAEREVSALAGTGAARAAGLAALLESALRHAAEHGDADCPVCGTPGAIGEDWRNRAAAAIVRLREEAAAVEAARRRLAAARAEATGLLADKPPGALSRAEGLGLDGAPLRDAWLAWRAARAIEVGPSQAARAALAAVHETARRLAADARQELERREDLWRPVANELARWLPEARERLHAARHQSTLKAAEEWVKSAAADLRSERIAPIARRAKANWDELRQDSNVSLEAFELRRSGNVRAAAIDVRVDGTDASAMGVMSQGELHALAISVFLPRAALADSPFRFIVIDDPVQSMDPAKVDGLARVLAATAAERQVVVFTHDARLPEALRRLALDATILEVTRRPGSRVEVRRGDDPVERYVADARALALTESLPAEVASRVVPGFCRHAIEAGCVAAVRRRRLGRGDSHADVEEALRGATTVMLHLSLALFDDAGKGSQVLTAIANRFGKRYADAVVKANKGVHELLATDLRDFVRDCAILARDLRDLR